MVILEIPVADGTIPSLEMRLIQNDSQDVNIKMHDIEIFCDGGGLVPS